MKQKIVVIISLLLISVLLPINSNAYQAADSFIFPIDGYTDDGCLDWGAQVYRDGILKNHVGDDYCAPEGTDVITIGNGRIKFTFDDPTGENLPPRGWYGLILSASISRKE